MVSKFIVHQHKTGRVHFDLRLVQENVLRSWSLLKEPPSRKGEQRLAIERENFPPEDMHRLSFKEDAFGEGRVYTWDEGEVVISGASPQRLSLILRGKKLSGKYEMRHMNWYPGNRWLLKKESGDLT